MFGGDGYHVIVYEPTVKGEYMEFPVEEDPDMSRDGCDVILANRMAEELRPVIGKVCCMDISMRIETFSIDCCSA